MGKNANFVQLPRTDPTDLEGWTFASSQSHGVRTTWQSHENIDQQGAPQRPSPNRYIELMILYAVGGAVRLRGVWQENGLVYNFETFRGHRVGRN